MLNNFMFILKNPFIDSQGDRCIHYHWDHLSINRYLSGIERHSGWLNRLKGKTMQATIPINLLMIYDIQS